MTDYGACLRGDGWECLPLKGGDSCKGCSKNLAEAGPAHVEGSISAVVPGYALSERDYYMLARGYDQGRFDGYHSSVSPDKTMTDWLLSSAADGVTVEMVLAKNAPLK